MVSVTELGGVEQYDLIGRGYSRHRRADARIRTALELELVGLRSVANVGAGSGSYEPTATTVAVEPSTVMIDQRPEGSAPVVQASAESIPLPDDVAEGALAVLTTHLWVDLEAGLSELRRIASKRIVVLTFDPVVTSRFWLLQEYFPHLAAAEKMREAFLARTVSALGPHTRVRPVPVPWDCVDGFAAAYWRRPEAYLDPLVRAATSVLSRLSEDDQGLLRLQDDLSSGEWAARHRELLDLEELDAGYRIVTTDLTRLP